MLFACKLIQSILSVLLVILVLSQQGNARPWTGAGGVQDGYWNKVKGRSKDGVIKRLTAFVVVLWVAIAIVVNLV